MLRYMATNPNTFLIRERIDQLYNYYGRRPVNRSIAGINDNDEIYRHINNLFLTYPIIMKQLQYEEFIKPFEKTK